MRRSRLGSEAHIHSPSSNQPTSAIRLFLARLALHVLRFSRSAAILFGKPIAGALLLLGGGFVRLILLPAYKIILLIRLRMLRLVASARGFVFFLFTSRYLFHGVVTVIALVTITSQIQPRQANAIDAGHHSLLYTLATHGQEEVVVEQVYPDKLHKDANYLGASTLKPSSNIDFDYANQDNANAADLTLPGSIAVQPLPLPSASQAPALDHQLSTNTATPANPAPAAPLQPGIANYTIAAGDTLAAIARRFKINVGTILWANDLNAHAILKVGTVLRIPPVSGVIHLVKSGDTLSKLAARYQVRAEDIQTSNQLGPEQTLVVGNEVMIPGGSPTETTQPNPPPVKPVAVDSPTPENIPVSDAPVTDIPTSQAELNHLGNEVVAGIKDVIQPHPVDVPIPADADLSAAPKSKLLWPTDLHGITQYYGWLHTGLDIDGDFSNRIFAADDGVVDKAGWNNGGYGLQIMIDHQDGLQTRYAHASRIFVKPGDQVHRGQVIGMVGTTGRSTGSHLHFEVYVNGNRTNPLGYVR